ncbi:hypothetical protein B9S53_01950 [Arthrospira sp. O9.13F]|nr:hypothetical protein B9S53_01950 [Arthrospira sp. O9.13F]
MANITISDLRPAGADLFSDSESYLNEISDSELNTTNGGAGAIITFMIVTYLGYRHGYNQGC